MCLLSFLPGFKSRQGRALQLSNTSFKTELGKEILILKRMKTSSSQEKNGRREKTEGSIKDSSYGNDHKHGEEKIS